MLIDSGATLLRELSDSIASGSLCLVVGAGASVDAGGQRWTELIASMAGDDLPPGALGGLDPAWAATVATRAPGARQRLLDGLYPPNQLGPDWIWESAASSSARFEQLLLSALARICVLVALRAPDREYHALTYNFDTLLEEAIGAIGHVADGRCPRRERLVTCAPDKRLSRWWFMRRNGNPVHRRRITVLHPHGLAPRDCPDDSLVRDLVFDAQAYDDSLTTPFASHNVLQMATFAGLQCLFVGFSFNDYAVRRLLRVGVSLRRDHRDRPRHYAILPAPAPGVEAPLAAALDDLGVNCLFVPAFWVQKALLFKLVDQAESRWELGQRSLGHHGRAR